MELIREMAVPCICSFVACLAFGVQFNIRMKHLAAAAAGSAISQIVFYLLEGAGAGAVRCSFIAAAAVSVYSEIMARRLKAPVNMYLVVGIIPLVPGGLTYYTMLAIVTGDTNSIVSRGADAASIAFAIAMGIFAVSSLTRIFFAGGTRSRLGGVTPHAGRW